MMLVSFLFACLAAVSGFGSFHLAREARRMGDGGLGVGCLAWVCLSVCVCSCVIGAVLFGKATQ